MLQPHKTDLIEYFEFRRNGKIVEGAPLCGLTLKAAGSMRFRWNETNPNREKLFSLSSNSSSPSLTNLSLPNLNNMSSPSLNNMSSSGLTRGSIVPVQLDHTHIVYDVKSAEDTKNKIGDGIITKNPALIPTVTVADCMPLYLYDPITGVFGIVHSGWKGTGIIVDAIKLAEKNYGARVEDFCIILGPHIRDCCYIVNEERAAWFAENFTADCLRPLEAGVKVDWNTGGGKLYRLSLEKANLAAIKKAGVPDENIWIHPACTCCTKVDGDFIYGSNRRETTAAGQPDKFTVQAAFISY